MGILIICVIIVMICWFFFRPMVGKQTNTNGSSSNYTPPKESSWDKVIRYHNTFISYLENKGVACTDVNECMVGMPFNGNNLKSFQVIVDFGMLTEHKVDILGWDFMHFSADQQDAIAAACNECNTDPNIRFMSGDTNVRTIMHTYIDEDHWCEQCEALARRMAAIVGRSYPILLRALNS